MNKKPKPNQSLIEQLVAENEEMYRSKIEELGKQYGGTFVRDKKLYGVLLGLVKKYKAEHGVWPDELRPLEFPTESFVPIQLTFTIRVLDLEVQKWYFIRRSRIFGVVKLR